MKILVTGSAGHLGEAIMRTVQNSDIDATGIDILKSPYTDAVGSITNPEFVKSCLAGVDAVLHTATLHKPHVATHSRQQFIDTNITGTLVLLEAAIEAGVERFVFTSTTSAFGAALNTAKDQPAAWITEDVRSIPKNIYGTSKSAAEDLCQLFFRLHGLNCVVLRTSRFFPEEDDNKTLRESFSSDNAKANEFLFRRVDIEDAASAHLCALDRAPEIGFDKFIISATSPFTGMDRPRLRQYGPEVVAAKCPGYAAVYQSLDWRMFDGFDRVYVNEKARRLLGWRPKYDFDMILQQLESREPIGSDLARIVGSKGYHPDSFENGPYPVE